MNTVDTLIKWPGGKAREIKYIENLIPKFERYIEPFFGGGAMYFYLNPENAIINDISSNLITFYELVKDQNLEFAAYLRAYNTTFQNLLHACDTSIDSLVEIYYKLKNKEISSEEAKPLLMAFSSNLSKAINDKIEAQLILDNTDFENTLVEFALDKMLRTIKNEEKKAFNDADLRENLITGFTSGYYMYFRSVYNKIALKSNEFTDQAYNIANFYFIREYCYGSMFRYNSKGEFNIPYGGMSYNRKDFKCKIDNIFNSNVKKLFSGTEICCSDFEDFIVNHELTETDFMFLDPPYDTDFSEYEGKAFTKDDQRRLANVLKETKAKFILIIKNTDYIFSLYEQGFNVLCFDKTYTYNVRSRNERSVKHLVVTNIKTK